MIDNVNSRYEKEILEFDKEQEIEFIKTRIKEIMRNRLHKRGLVIAISGGIDSSVCAALAVKAIGEKKVLGLILPEKDSSAASAMKGKLLANHLGIDCIEQDIAPTLEAIGCYKWRDDAIREVFPEYSEGWKNKIIIKGGADGGINHFTLIVENHLGKQFSERLGLKQYLQIVAATNYKQRVRKTIEYFHADRLNYAVVGTPNRLEFDQGFFVKNGDGSADLKPIAHLYKTQVYALAKYLGLPDEICSAVPTTDTYSLEQGQDEFYFSLPYKEMDMALWAYNNNISSNDAEELLDMSVQNIEWIFRDIEKKRKTTEYLHLKALLIKEVL